MFYRFRYGRSQCPLLRQQLNFQQLQEMAREVPEEQYVGDTIIEGIEDPQGIQENLINGACGDTEVNVCLFSLIEFFIN